MVCLGWESKAWLVRTVLVWDKGGIVAAKQAASQQSFQELLGEACMLWWPVTWRGSAGCGKDLAEAGGDGL